jgi:hypothetical protein
VVDALAHLELPEVEAVVVLSPHGTASGVYGAVNGSLQAFGIPEPASAAPTDDRLVEELASRWGRPVLDANLDHGVHVPRLLLHRVRAPLVGACLDERLDEAEATEAAIAFARVVAASERSLAFVASAHTSSALSPRAPLGHRPEAESVVTDLVDALERGSGLGEAVRRVERDGASCGVASLIAFAELFPSARCEILANESPVGVGYLVARTVQ